jgi:S-adenosylmethionine:tRNA ribosyltransferase-isomerase
MDLAAFDYDLPERAIAQVPAEPRDAARLLVDQGAGQAPRHHHVADLPELVRPGDVLVVNTTRVLPARLQLRKPTGGAVEVLLLERDPAGTWEALVRPSRRVAAGTVLVAGEGLAVEVGGPADPVEGTRRVRLHLPGNDAGDSTSSSASGSSAAGDHLDDLAGELAALERHGAVPLPPYITAPLDDPERYQTVFAERPESVAAPTAGLHLTPAVLERCRAAGATVEPVELAVGLGTFRPMTAARVEDHDMHAERYRVPETTLKACRDARDGGGRVMAVGTTVVRALEAAAATTGEHPDVPVSEESRPHEGGGGVGLEGRTDLFIRRPFAWQLVDVLLTNFHLPRSSLLVLVDAFVGPRWRGLYGEALAAGYRFLSFGDAMLLQRTEGPAGAAGAGGAAGTAGTASR